jgi:nucleoside-diphosphate-sugar epimerase
MDRVSLGGMVAKIKKVLVCGAGGFIGNHLVSDLKEQGNYVIGADLVYPAYNQTLADEFYLLDLRSSDSVNKLLSMNIDTVYQLAADMGGAEYIFTGKNDANIMHNSAQINLNIVQNMVLTGVKKVFFTSSACVYPEHNQINPNDILISESSAYPANPDSEYGWEKLFSERLYLAYAKNHGLRVRIARLHNVFGTLCTWNDQRAKSPAALCRKVAQSDGTVEIYGNGNQTRSFLFIDECIKGIHLIMNSDCVHILNLGSSRMISINNLVHLIANIAEKQVRIVNVQGPIGVLARTSDNQLINQQLGWEPQDRLEYGLRQLYNWVSIQMAHKGKKL